MAWRSGSSHLIYCTYILFALIQLNGVKSFDLLSKSVYLLYGSEQYNSDIEYPLRTGEQGLPGGRTDSAVWVDHYGSMWTFGGYDGISYLNDMWRYYEGAWYWMGGTRGANDYGDYSSGLMQTGKPANRDGIAQWIDYAGDLWMFGGYSKLSAIAGFGPLNDLWRFSVASNSFTWVYGNAGLAPTNRTDGPSSRSHAASWALGDKLYLFGGLAADLTATNDLWVFDVAAMNWTLLYSNRTGVYGPTGSYPPARSGSSVTVDSNGAWIFGGLATDGHYMSDVWRFTFETSAWSWEGGRGNVDEVGKYPKALGGIGDPPARQGACSWFDKEGYLWIFGGYRLDPNGTAFYYGDFWKADTTVTIAWLWAGSSVVPEYPPAVNISGGPGPRAWSACWMDDIGDMFFYAGSNFAGVRNDYWALDMDDCAINNGGCVTNCTNVLAEPAVCAPCGAGMEGNPHVNCSDINECTINNGGCDLLTNCTYNPFTDPTCSPCPEGYYGTGYTGCTDINECEEVNNCSALGSTCTNTNGSYFCNCTAGFRGDGFTCTDIDECIEQPNNCSVDGKCINTNGSFYCACSSGYAGNGYNCSDINECVVGANNCSVIGSSCTNTNGSFICNCTKGYVGDGFKCVDFNECSVNNGGCDKLANCTSNFLDTPPTCGPCPSGYNGTGNTSCVDFDECSVNNGNCDPLTNCTNNAVSGVAALCGACPPTYYTGTGYKGCVDIDECETNKGGCDPLTTCKNIVGEPPTCGPCPSGFVGNGKSGCIDFDECTVNNGGCTAQTVCTNNIGAPPTCGPCINGFIGNNWCSSSSSHNSQSAALIAGVTVGGFIVLLAVIGLIFYFTKDKMINKSPSKTRLSSNYSPRNFELATLSAQ